MREIILALVLLLSACVCAHARPYPQAYFAPPPAREIRTEGGTWYAVQRPCWIGQFCFGPIWVFCPSQPQPASPPQ